MGESTHQGRQKLLRLLDWVFADIGAFICILVAGGFSASQFPDLWPFPGLYFIELVLIGILGGISRTASKWHNHPISTNIPWVDAGILLSFVILGGLSIGPFLFPAMLAFIISGIFVDSQQMHKLPGHVGIAIISGLVQSGVVIAFAMF
jgi:hypothetical protein